MVDGRLQFRWKEPPSAFSRQAITEVAVSQTAAERECMISCRKSIGTTAVHFSYPLVLAFTQE